MPAYLFIRGGPMYVMERAMHCKPLAICFAVFTLMACTGIGSMVQSNAVSGYSAEVFHIPPMATGILEAILIAAIVWGGLKFISRVCGTLVPFMAILYVLGCFTIIIINYQTLLSALKLIITSAFSLKAIGGGFFGTMLMMALRYAAQRNLKSVRDQVDNLARKDYSSYISGGRKSLGYVLMYVPVYGALQLAKSLDQNIWRDAFRKNVLITTEETLAPFLRMIRTAWCNVEQVRNQQNIISAAEDMISRVYDLATGYAKIGKKMEELRTAYDACDRKLKDSGQSIIVSARKVISYGVKPRAGKSDFPALYGSEVADGAASSDVSEE